MTGAHRSLERLLEPRSIAMIGGDAALQAVLQSERLGFEGAIWPVHPTRRSMAGHTVYRSLADLPGAPDAAFVAVNRWKTVELVPQLAELGCGGAVLYASGFAESGKHGAELQEQLVAGHGMPLIGPNCYGTINALNGAALWPDVHGCRRVDRGPALISQSGNIALNLTMNDRGVDFTHVIALGNQSSVTVEECLQYLAERPEVTAVGIYLESITDSVAFGKAALACHESNTPVVVLKTGRTEVAGRITESHTAALVTPAAAYDALFERYGVVSVHTLPQFVTTLGLLGTIGTLRGNRLVSLSFSGGEAALVADRAVGYPVVFDPFAPEQAARVRATLSDLVTINNPLDYHTFIWGDAVALERCFVAVLDGPFDAALLVIDWPAAGNDDSAWWPTLDAFARATSRTGKPGVIAASLTENLPSRIREYAQAAGLGVAYSIDEALTGLAAAALIGNWFASEAPPLHLPPGNSAPIATHRILDEPSAKALLRAARIRTPDGVVVNNDDPEAVDEVVADRAFPLVAKLVGVAHKTDRDGVITGIHTPDQLALAIQRLGGGTRPLLVEEQITAGTELLVSVRREEPVGIVATVGAGGTMVELISDSTTLLLPALAPVLHQAVSRLGIGSRLLASGGNPRSSTGMLNAVIYRLLDVLDRHPEVVEIEINPLIVTPDSAWAVDALVTTSAPVG